MKFYRRWFVTIASRIGVHGSGGADAEYLARDGGSSRQILILYVAVLAVLILLTIVSVPGLLQLVKSNALYTIGVWCVIWGAFVGVTVALVLPNQLVATITGAIGGVTASDLSSATSLVTKAVDGVDPVVKAVATVIVPASQTPDFFVIRIWVLLFLGAAGLVCLPALFRD